jgi:hypothetical protein
MLTDHEVLLMQMHGKSSIAWQFTGYASQVCVALGYHKPLDFIEDIDTREEIIRAVNFLMLMDASLSMCFERAPSLPVVERSRYAGQVSRETQINGKLQTIVRCLVEFGLVQRDFLDLKIQSFDTEDPGKHCDTAMRLKATLQSIHTYYGEVIVTICLQKTTYSSISDSTLRTS